MAQFSRFLIPVPTNQPCWNYVPGTESAIKLKQACEKMRKELPYDVPLIINGKEVRNGKKKEQLICSDHKNVLCKFDVVDENLIQKAVDGAMKAKKHWEELPFETRAGIFLKAADLMVGKYRYEMMASTILGQGKNVWQAEIDCIAELADFLRFNVKFAEEIYSMQPKINPAGMWNRVEYRPLEGFVLAITPFNFTAIGGNLPTSPAILGNVSLWKPSSTSILSNYIFAKILQEAGLPDGVIQFIPGSGSVIGRTLLSNKNLGGVHFTGSTEVFKHIWMEAAKFTMDTYKSYPRIVGETGGKNYHFIHESADLDHVANSTVRGAYEYQGQKCSATSRMYVPKNVWPKLREKLEAIIKQIKMGQSDDFSVFMSAVIDKASFDNIKNYIEGAKKDPDSEVIIGGKCDDSVGWFVEPTVILTKNPKSKTMVEEIFGPVLTIYLYDPDKYEETLDLCDNTSEYGLCGAIFAQERNALDYAVKRLRNTAGNFYINDKSTGSVVGQQPFGGARASGNNQKAGAIINLLNWCSPRSIKENFVPLTDFRYPHMGQK
ncbi:delta-1-pyrroline-5-carboxylate dehydrogenase 1 isoform a-related [Anaeramoeba ignava]|uniref:Multifunctional fusion protein n=1 Tax=Anaeramoeba ignava TaxID=1746090 RepID=A0A9Q0LGZ5_ANAIG|nr:delta-1-pyrroline-5-carboxylate dehydrogenase 1 isoform a-related [Anaeramoeba ignava]